MKPNHGIPWLLAGALLGIASGAAAGDTAGGSEGWELDLPRGAVEAVAGAAAFADPAGASAIGLNPARLADLTGPSLAAGYTRLPLGLADGHLAGAVPLGGWGGLGAALRVLRVEVPGTREDLTGGYAGPGDPVLAQTVIGSVAWAPDLSGLDGGLGVRLRAGLGLDLLRRDLAGMGTTGGGGGLAVTAGWTGGIAAFARLHHLGWTDGVAWPLGVAAGGSWTRRDSVTDGDRVRWTVAATWGRERGPGAASLLEFGIDGERFGATARVGWQIGTVERVSPLPAAGFSLRASHLTLDAGWAPLGPFGWATSLSLGWTVIGADAGT